MSFSYDVTKLDTELNRIRLELGDTDETDFFLHDEEITQIQSENSTFNSRVASCCLMICSKVAREADHKIGDSSEDSAIIYDRYYKMWMHYNVRVAYPWAGSISDSEKTAQEDNEDNIKPKIKKGIHDNPTVSSN